MVMMYFLDQKATLPMMLQLTRKATLLMMLQPRQKVTLPLRLLQIGWAWRSMKMVMAYRKVQGQRLRRPLCHLLDGISLWALSTLLGAPSGDRKSARSEYHLMLRELRQVVPPALVHLNDLPSVPPDRERN